MCLMLTAAADQPVIPGVGITLDVSIDDRVAFLEQQVAQLVMMVDMMKVQVWYSSQVWLCMLVYIFVGFC